MTLVFDISGFEALFQVNYPLLCISSYRIVQDKDIAENIVQDVFLELWEQRDKLVLKSSVKAYLFRAAINQSVNYVKKYKNAVRQESLYTDVGEEELSLLEWTMALSENKPRVESAVRVWRRLPG